MEGLVQVNNLFEQDDIFSLIFENSPANILILDQEGNIIHVNETSRRTLGYSKREFESMTLMDINIQTPDLSSFQKLLEGLQKQTSILTTSLFTKKDKTALPVQLNISKIPKIDQTLFIVRAQALSKETHKEIHTFEEMFKRLFDHSNDSVFILNERGDFINCNPKASKATGYSKSELKSQSLLFLSAEYQLNKKLSSELIPDLIKETIKGKNLKFEWQLRKKNGIEFPAKVILTAFEIDNENFIYGIIKDISEKKQYEDKILKSKNELELIFNNSTSILILLDEETNILDLNEAALHFAGETKENIINKRPGNAFGCINVFQSNKTCGLTRHCGGCTIRKTITDTIKTGQSHYKVEAPFTTTRNGTVKDYLFLLSSITIDTSPSNKILIILDDVTDIKNEEDIKSAILGLHDFAYEHPLEDFIHNFICKIEELTGSALGFFHFTENGQWLKFWSKNTQKNCSSIKNFPTQETWEKCLETKMPVILNSNSQNDNNCPTVIRELAVPIIRNHKMVGIVGVGNKKKAYLQQNVNLVYQIAQIAWETIERKRTETSLLESENRLSSFINSASDYFFLLDKDLNCIELNKQGMHFLGVKSTDEIVGRKFSEIFPGSLSSERFDAFQNVFRTGNPLVTEELIEHPDFGLMHLVFKTFMVNDELGVIASDITAMKQAQQIAENNEQKLKEAQELAKIGSWELDFMTNKITWSDETYHIFKCSREEFKNNYESFQSFIHPEDIQMVNDAFQDHINNKKEYDILHRLLLSDHSVVYVNERCKTLFDNEGNPIRSLGTVADLTEQIVRENELKAAKEKAEESDQLKDEFLRNLSHEIRTPMNGIMGFTEFLCQTDISPSQRENYARIVQSSSRQLLQIIDDLVEISNLGTKQVKAELTPFLLNDLLMELFSIHNLKALENNLKLYIKKELRDDESTIKSDRSKLSKILNNLIENALKYTVSGFIEIGYTLKGNDTISIYVKDTGIGIETKDYKTIFERFSQAEKDISKKGGGLGLGLSIAEENAKLLGGSIELESERGKGSTFYLSLPFNRPTTDDELFLEPSQKNEEQNMTYTLLIAEDEHINFLFMEVLFAEEIEGNYNLIHAKNGKEAVDICLEKENIDLVLMDIKMPEMNGHEATSIIKTKRPDLPIVAQTAYTAKSDIEISKKHGFDDFISKPINKGQLIQIINKYLKIE